MTCEQCEREGADVRGRVILVPGSGGYHAEERDLCDECLYEVRGEYR